MSFDELFDLAAGAYSKQTNCYDERCSIVSLRVHLAWGGLFLLYTPHPLFFFCGGGVSSKPQNEVPLDGQTPPPTWSRYSYNILFSQNKKSDNKFEQSGAPPRHSKKQFLDKIPRLRVKERQPFFTPTGHEPLTRVTLRLPGPKYFEAI